ncbi:MerR family DNA-binding transcriptional regulator [Marinobacterium zhoushanense]|uniref:MerR family DNA-binding transcriptional regulator n=1 Tax=Marinobacterium zhoushanense TaxID=1679163 RepID=UPI00166779AC
MKRLGNGKLAQRQGLSVETLRYYARRGLIPPPERLPAGRRSHFCNGCSTLCRDRQVSGVARAALSDCPASGFSLSTATATGYLRRLLISGRRAELRLRPEFPSAPHRPGDGRTVRWSPPRRYC